MTTSSRVIGAGRPRPMFSTSLTRRVELGQQAVEHRDGPVQPLAVAVVLGDRLALVGDHLAGQVAERDPDVPVPEVDPDDEAGTAGDPHRRPPAAAAHHRLDHARRRSGRGRCWTPSPARARCCGRCRPGSAARPAVCCWSSRDHPALVGGAQGRGRPGGRGRRGGRRHALLAWLNCVLRGIRRQDMTTKWQPGQRGATLRSSLDGNSVTEHTLTETGPPGANARSHEEEQWHFPSGERRLTAAALVIGAGGLAACGANEAQNGSEGGDGAKKIALLLPESKTTRYEAFDKPLFEDKVAELCSDCEVVYFNADQDPAKQQQQVETAITDQVDAIVLDPVDGEAAGGSGRLTRRRPTSRSSPTTGSSRAPTTTCPSTTPRSASCRPRRSSRPMGGSGEHPDAQRRADRPERRPVQGGRAQRPRRQRRRHPRGVRQPRLEPGQRPAVDHRPARQVRARPRSRASTPPTTARPAVWSPR